MLLYLDQKMMVIKPYVTGGIWAVSLLWNEVVIIPLWCWLQCSLKIPSLLKNNLEKLAQQHTEVCSTTLSGCEVNGTPVIVVACEESESAFFLDVFTTGSVQLHVIHYSLEIENIKSIIKIQASIIQSWHRLLGWSVSKKNRQVKLRRGSTMVIKLALNQPYAFTNLCQCSQGEIC